MNRNKTFYHSFMESQGKTHTVCWTIENLGKMKSIEKFHWRTGDLDYLTRKEEVQQELNEVHENPRSKKVTVLRPNR